jgi:hypothetical protein
MEYSAEAKLYELHNKTTRELVSLIGNKLDRGLAFARLPEGEDRAAKEYAEVSAWMPLLEDATLLERRELEGKLSRLRSALSSSQVQMQAAC